MTSFNNIDYTSQIKKCKESFDTCLNDFKKWYTKPGSKEYDTSISNLDKVFSDLSDIVIKMNEQMDSMHSNSLVHTSNISIGDSIDQYRIQYYYNWEMIFGIFLITIIIIRYLSTNK